MTPHERHLVTIHALRVNAAWYRLHGRVEAAQRCERVLEKTQRAARSGGGES
jgi:hypothetical protein